MHRLSEEFFLLPILFTLVSDYFVETSLHAYVQAYTLSKKKLKKTYVPIIK